MIYQVLKTFKIRTSQGEMELKPDQLVGLRDEVASVLLEEGKIAPALSQAKDKGQGFTPKDYRIIYSRILNDFLLIVDISEQAEALQRRGVKDVIYTAQEIHELKDFPEVSVKAVHMIKKSFPGARIEGETSKRKEKQ